MLTFYSRIKGFFRTFEKLTPHRHDGCHDLIHVENNSSLTSSSQTQSQRQEYTPVNRQMRFLTANLLPLFTTTRSIVPSSAHAIIPAKTFLNPVTGTSSSSVAAMSSSTPTSGPENDTSQTQDPNPSSQDPKTRQEQPLPLPEPSLSNAGNATHQIDLSYGTGTAKLDHLGPLVVNTDGTLSRIGNWAQMMEVERTNTLRVLGRRNQVRLKALREQQQQQQREEGKGDGRMA